MTKIETSRQAPRISGGDYVAPTSLPLDRHTVSYEVMALGFLGSFRALILQTTHPLVAAGVAEHSDYQSDPMSRAFRTFDTVTKLLYGSPEVSRRQTSRMEKRHRPVVGTAPDGRGYDARDRELGLWVWATLTDTALYSYERVHGRLHRIDRDRYYEEQKLFAVGCSVPLELVPPTIDDFEDYVARVIDEDLEATEQGRDIEHFASAPLFRGRFWAMFSRLAQWTEAAMFPPKLREIYGRAWTDRQERNFERFLTALRVIDRAAPSVVSRGLFVNLVVERDVLVRLERMNMRRRATAKRKKAAAA